jgi:ribosomal protein S18 acetylase RimI-like enzyme
VRTWLATPGEAATVTGLMCEFRDWWEYEEPSDDAMRAGVERLIADAATDFLLAAGADGVPAGVCQLRYRYGVWKAAPDCWLEDLYVRAGARRAGLGRALVAAAVERARARGCRRVELDVSEANRGAMALYEALGFSARSPRTGARNLLMRRPLD